jgi:hypothetical protein
MARAVGGLAPDLKDRDRMVVPHDADVMTALTTSDEWHHRAMGNKRDRTVRNKIGYDKVPMDRRRDDVAVRHSLPRDPAECSASGAVQADPAALIAVPAIVEIAMDAPIAAVRCGLKLDSLDAVDRGTIVVLMDPVVLHRPAGLAR